MPKPIRRYPVKDRDELIREWLAGTIVLGAPPFYETAQRRRYKEFYQFLQAGKPKRILDAYEKKGGNAEQLWWVLWRLREITPRPLFPTDGRWRPCSGSCAG